MPDMMSQGDNELSLSEMRMLTSSVVHMDVRQIALCVVTIPKLKTAIQDLLLTSPPPFTPAKVRELGLRYSILVNIVSIKSSMYYVEYCGSFVCLLVSAGHFVPYLTGLSSMMLI